MVRFGSHLLDDVLQDFYSALQRLMEKAGECIFNPLAYKTRNNVSQIGDTEGCHKPGYKSESQRVS